MVRPGEGHGARSAEVIEAIKVVSTRGDGVNTIFREVISYWSKDGVLLAEVDLFAEQHQQEGTT